LSPNSDVYSEEIVKLYSKDSIEWGSDWTNAATCDTWRAKLAAELHFESPVLEKGPLTYGKLTLGGRVIKQFNQLADHQTAILAQFQAGRWVPRIPSPLHEGVKTKRERECANHALGQALAALNRGTKEILRFKADRGFVEWQPSPEMQ
jgi:hypothetical protein